MRRSDPRLTANVHTDESLLPLQEVSIKLPAISSPWSHILTQISDESGQNESQAVAKPSQNVRGVETKKPLQNKGLVGVSHSLSQLDVLFGSGRPTRTRT